MIFQSAEVAEGFLGVVNHVHALPGYLAPNCNVCGGHATMWGVQRSLKEVVLACDKCEYSRDLRPSEAMGYIQLLDRWPVPPR